MRAYVMETLKVGAVTRLSRVSGIDKLPLDTRFDMCLV